MPAAVRYPMLSISMERESIPVETVHPDEVPDPKWRYVDEKGHGHFWDGRELPTLEWVVTGKERVGDEYDGEEYDVGEWRCKLCAETIEPGTKLEYGPKEIPGLTTFTVTIDGEEFVLTEHQYAASVEAWRNALRSATKREP